jgi:CRISPR-associated endonuclease/helicase Cas3
MPHARPESVAHSPPHDHPDRLPQPYRCHVAAVREGVQRRVEAMLTYAPTVPADLLTSTISAAVFHDLGKLDDDNQAPLSKSRSGKLLWDHVDAGVAHLLGCGDDVAAWLVRAHHSPGLPCYSLEDALPHRLRGKRKRDLAEGEHDTLIARVDARLPEYLAEHERACGPHPVCSAKDRPIHGLSMRLALSCLVDADHTDSAAYDEGIPTPMPGDDRVETRWAERLAQLERVVARKAQQAEANGLGDRARDRTEFFRHCLESPVDEPLVRCEGPVGIGKTLAITANLLRYAEGKNDRPRLRHIVIVAPYTNIITQTVKELRTALVLPGENPEEVVAEHHHRADFSCRESRMLATLWRAPIIVTTAVQFFETLASNEPSRLRKLHELPGSAVFLDEAHAALPVHLWPQNWKWVKALAEKWGCRFVFASGSLARFWEIERIVVDPMELPDLVIATNEGRALTERLHEREGERVRYGSIQRGLSIDELCGRVRTSNGPRLVILNTVQTAALVAKRMREAGDDVLHLSTALCPRDRERILQDVQARLEVEQATWRSGAPEEEIRGLRNWILVATSCVEAGVDLSFQTAFRERATAASVIQIGGRVNRHRDRSDSIVYDFTLSMEKGVTSNPGLKHAIDVLSWMIKRDALNREKPADVVTAAIEHELDELVTFAETLTEAERDRDYPLVATDGRVIDDDTVVVVVDPELRDRLSSAKERVSSTELLRLSVQLRRRKVRDLGLESLRGLQEIYFWSGVYDPEFLGVMEDFFRTDEAFTRDYGVV